MSFGQFTPPEKHSSKLVDQLQEASIAFGMSVYDQDSLGSSTANAMSHATLMNLPAGRYNRDTIDRMIEAYYMESLPE